MALPAYWKLTAENQTGEQIDANEITVDYREYSGDGSGGSTYDSSETTVQNGSAISDTNSGDLASGITYPVDNTSNGSIGIAGDFTVDLSDGTSPDGDVELYLEGSTDGGTSYSRSPSPIAIVSFDGTAESDDTQFLI